MFFAGTVAFVWVGKSLGLLSAASCLKKFSGAKMATVCVVGTSAPLLFVISSAEWFCYRWAFVEWWVKATESKREAVVARSGLAWAETRSFGTSESAGADS